MSDLVAGTTGQREEEGERRKREEGSRGREGRREEGGEEERRQEEGEGRAERGRRKIKEREVDQGP